MAKALMGKPMAEAWLQRDQLDRLYAANWEVVVSAAAPPLSEADYLKDIDGVTHLFANGTDIVSSSVIRAATDLKGIFRTGVGFDCVDVEEAKARGVPVCITPGANTETVADMTFALMLGLSRKLLSNHLVLRNGDWASESSNNVHGKVLGIVGMGRIGRAVARRANAFNMQVCVYDPFVKQEELDDMGVDSVELNDLFATSDFVTLHLPASEDIGAIVTTPMLDMMKPSAYIVNTARGALIDESALKKALRSGSIAGAGLDVFIGEPNPDSELLAMDNVIVSPHVAGITAETQREVARMCVDNALAVEAGDWSDQVVANGVYS